MQRCNFYHGPHVYIYIYSALLVLLVIVIIYLLSVGLLDMDTIV